MVVTGIEHKIQGSSIVPLGGLLPYYLEVRTSQLLDLLIILFPNSENSNKQRREKINKYLYSKTSPGFYLEINEHLHLAYARAAASCQ